MKSLSVTIQLKVTEQNFPVALFIMLYRVVLTFDFKILNYFPSCHVIRFR